MEIAQKHKISYFQALKSRKKKTTDTTVRLGCVRTPEYEESTGLLLLSRKNQQILSWSDEKRADSFLRNLVGYIIL